MATVQVGGIGCHFKQWSQAEGQKAFSKCMFMNPCHTSFHCSIQEKVVYGDIIPGGGERGEERELIWWW